MKKTIQTLLLLLCLTAMLCVPALAANPTFAEAFPDPVFREFVTDNVLMYSRDSKEDDAVISEAQMDIIANTPTVNLYNQGITSLQGIKYFVILQNLNCATNNLIELDVSGCTKLQNLNCSVNNLTELDVSGCTALEVLSCDRNNLSELDMSNFAKLRQLNCENNDLSKLDVSGCSELRYFYCYDNDLTELDVSDCTSLLNLDCSDNSLTVLDICSNTNMTACAASAQTSTKDDIKIIPRGDVWTLDMEAFLGENGNVEYVTMTDGGVLENGTVTYTEKPEMVTYTYDIGIGDMDVTWESVFGGPVIIAEGKINGDTITWMLDEEGLLTFEGTGPIPNYSNDSQPWRIYIDRIKALQVSDGITSIGSSAFYGYYNLETAELGRDVKSVGTRTFGGCTKLTELTISDAMDVANYEGYQYSFEDTPLRTVYVPATVTFIEDNFYNKTSITEFVCAGDGMDGYFDVDGVLYHRDDYTGVQTLVKVPHSMDLPDTLTVVDGTHIIGEKAVQNNSSFKWVDLPEGLQTIKGHAFEECDSLLDVFYSEGLITIEDYAFHHCDRLLRVELPDSTTTIKADAFKECGWLYEVKLGRGVTSVGPRAFEACPNLTELTLSDAMDVANYEGYQYSFGDTPIQIVTVPATVTFIEDNFYNKSTITEFVCEGTGEKDYFDIDGVLYHKDDYTGTQTLVKAPHAMDLPDTYTVLEGTHIIGERAFIDNDSFAALVLCDGLQTIKANAFQECDGLLTIDFANGLTTIEDYAFHHCDSLLHIDLPDSVTTIKADAFKECGWLEEVVLGRGVTSVGPRTFEACPKLTELTLSDAMDVANYEGYNYSFGDTPIQIVHVPATVTFIENNYYNKTSIIQFVCEGTGERDYFDIDGVLYHKDPYTNTQTLVKVPHAMELPATFEVMDGTHIIGENAVLENDSFIGLVLPEGLQTIKGHAFQGCDYMETIDFADGLTTIEDYAFHHCDRLRSVELPDSMTTIKADAFKECGWLEKVDLGRSVTSVGPRAFEACPKLTELTISDAMDVANYEGYNYSFDNTPIRIVHVPATVTFIEDNFYNKSTITEFACEGTGEYGYFDVDGVLYYKDKATGTQTLRKVPNKMELPTTFTVLAGTHIIGDNAASNHDSVENLLLPDGLQTIGVAARSDCDNLLTL